MREEVMVEEVFLKGEHIVTTDGDDQWWSPDGPVLMLVSEEDNHTWATDKSISKRLCI